MSVCCIKTVLNLLDEGEFPMCGRNRLDRIISQRMFIVSHVAFCGDISPITLTCDDECITLDVAFNCNGA